MFQLERQERILQFINQRQTVRTQELCEMFNVSPVTIRSDINDLARRALIIKSRGGAMSVQRWTHLELPSDVRSQQNKEAKQKITTIAAGLIQDNEVIILDSGSTTLEIARRIKSRGVTVITNDLKIALLLAEQSNVSVFMTSGSILPSVHVAVGSEAIQFFDRTKVSKLFLGCDAIDLDWGISCRTLDAMSTKRSMLRAAQEVLAVADYSKFHRQVFMRMCDMGDIQTLITDKLEPEEHKRLEQLGVRVIIAEK